MTAEDVIAAVPSVLTHNGKFTVKSVATGEHRTYRVRTQDQDSRFAPGKRVIGILTGPDNTNDYLNFGFVTEKGIEVWSRQSTKFAQHAKMLTNMLANVLTGKIEVYAETKCRVCNRTLTTPESVKSGIGPICEGR